MKNKKHFTKLIALLLSLTLIGGSVFLFSSCGDNEDDDYSKIEWPDSKIASLIPKPKSSMGEIIIDDSDSLSITISETELDDYKTYVKDCKSKGFKVDYSNMDDYYSAENKDGYSLTLSYDKDEKTMDISLYSPSKGEDNKDSETKETSKKSSKSSKTKSSKASSKSKAGTSTNFKKTMDEYEKFMNKYVDFMKKYNKSDNALELLSDYSDMMDKYNKFSKKIEDIDENSLSTEDYAYYIEVTNRVNKKLLEVAS